MATKVQRCCRCTTGICENCQCIDQNVYCTNCCPMKEKSCTNQKKSYSASDFRDPNVQDKFRQLSRSEYKERKDVGHILSLGIAAEVLNHYRDTGKPPRDELSKVKTFLNDFDNFRMVLKYTNKTIHVCLDNEIMYKRRIRGVLSSDAEKRARGQVKFIQDHQCKLDLSTYAAFRKFYVDLKIASGNKVWDKRNDKADKK